MGSEPYNGLSGFVSVLRNISIFRVMAFVIGGVLALQITRFLQYGSLASPIDYPAPAVVGIIAGLLLAIATHISSVTKIRLKTEIDAKEALLNSLKLSEERLSLATKQSSIWDWNILNDDLYLSPGFATSLGYTQAELKEAMKGSTKNLLHPDDVDGYINNLNAHLKNPETVFVNEHRFKTKSGNYRWFLAFGQSVIDENGRAVRFNGTTTDITDRIDLEARLHQTQKMETIGTLTGGVAHDFNNLLTIIMGNLELLDDEVTSPDQKELIRNGIEATLRGAELTRNMLSFARKAPLEPSVIDLNQLVGNLKNWIGRTLPSTIDVETSFLAGLWPVEVDPSSTESGLLNLILNARDAMPQGGKLTIETSNVRIDDDYVELRGEEIHPGRYVLLAVSDTGGGIPPENLDNIFVPFFSTKPDGASSGLGLSMLEGFMRQSGGTIRVYSEQEVGTTFKLYFPATERTDVVRLSSEEPVPHSTLKNRATLLLVDDNIDALSALRITLMKSGFHVLEAASGDEAFKLFKQNRGIDLLLTDIVMPGKLQGTTLAKKLREMDANLKVVFMSGYAAEATVHGNGLRPNDIRLMKPIRRGDLLRAVEKALWSDKKQ